MLVLSRCEGERIRVGPDITITVVRLSGGSVRLGIEAPRGVLIARQELLDRAALALAASPQIAVTTDMPLAPASCK